MPSIAAAAVFTAAISNNANIFTSGNLILSGTTGSAVCASSLSTITSDQATCSGAPSPTSTLSTSTTSSASTTLSSTGSLSAASGLVASNGCGVVEFADASSAASNPALPVAGVSLGSTMSKLASTGATFDGSTGWAETVNSFANPETFSLAGWFNTSGPGGTLMGFSSVQTNAGSTTNDRELWIDGAGKLVWATSTNGTTKTELTSATAYNNGAWHYVVATIGAAGQSLYVDGALAATTVTGTTSAWNYTGYWTLGWGSEKSATPAWTDTPTSAYFTGTLADFAVIPSQLTLSQVGTLYAATASQSVYNAAVATFAPTSFWPMNDVGSTPYSGALPTLSAVALKFYDQSGHANNASATNAALVTTAQTGPLGATAVSLSGASGSDIYAATSSASSQTVSQSVWFKTTSSGVVMSFTSATADTGTPSDYDHLLWIDPTGHLVYGVAYGSTPTRSEAVSSATYNNGTWHLATATLGTTGALLYVDGALAASYASALSVQAYTGYWHLGYGYASTWSDAPSSNYFNGSLSQAAVVPTQLTAAQVTSLARATTSGVEEYTVLNLNPSGYWPLNDTVLSPACSLVEVTIGAVKGASSTCVEPVSASACVAPTTSLEANNVLAKSLPAPLVGTAVTITVSLRLASTPAVGVAGLHLLIPLTFMTQDSSFNNQLFYNLSQATL